MYENLIREHLKSSLPPGIFWTPYNNFSDLLDALTDQLTPYFERAIKTACIRDPQDSERYLDLADEYAAEFFSSLSEQEIRDLTTQMKIGVTEPGAGDLQAALNNSGFPVQVHSNAPKPTNPINFIGDDIPVMVADNIEAVADNENAYAGSFPGVDVLINGLVKATVSVVLSGADVGFMVADNENAVADYYEDTEAAEFSFMLPEDPDRWNNVYFIGGDDDRSVDGELISIEYVEIPQERQTEFENLILKYGPGDGWCGLFINYV